MLYTTIQGIDKSVSRIFYGTAMDPIMLGGDCGELLDSIYETGITAFDTARNYAKAEESIGKWIQSRKNRENIVLLTKCAHPCTITGKNRVSEKEIREDFAVSAKALCTDYFDIYLLHRDDPEVPVGEIVELLNQMHKEGKIKAFGGSNWTHERVKAANEYAQAHGLIPFTVSSPNYGLAEQIQDPWGHGCTTITGAANADARAWYAQNQMPIIAYSSLGRGLFSGRMKSEDSANAQEYLDETAMKGYGCPENFERLRRCELLAAEKGCSVSQLALSWMFHQNINAYAVISTSKASRMRENIAALEIPLTAEESKYLNLE